MYSTFLGHNVTKPALPSQSTAKGQAYVAGNSGAQCTALSGGNAVDPAVTASRRQPTRCCRDRLLTPYDQPEQLQPGLRVHLRIGCRRRQVALFEFVGRRPAISRPAMNTLRLARVWRWIRPDTSTLVGNHRKAIELPVTPGAFQTTYYGNPNPGYSGPPARGFRGEIQSG